MAILNNNFFISKTKTMYVNFLTKRPSVKKGKAIIYIMSFPKSDSGLLEKLAAIYGEKLLVFYTPRCREYAEYLASQGIHVASFTPKGLLLKNYFAWIQGAQLVLVDNYFPELASLKKDKTVIQLWHATGAVKTFGWLDKQTRKRSKSDQKRFQAVYDAITDIVVASDQMQMIFQESWHYTGNFLKVGLPKTVLPAIEQPSKKDSPTFLYAPTYREDKEKSKQFVQEMLQVFSKFPQYNLLIKLHPHDQERLNLAVDFPRSAANSHFSTMTLEELYQKSDYLITDYSSSIFDFSTIKKAPAILFYCPDSKEYAENPGLQAYFLNQEVPGPILNTQAELALRLQQLDLSEYTKQYQHFVSKWNQYNSEDSMLQLIEVIQERM